jgi:hypothetical protein
MSDKIPLQVQATLSGYKSLTNSIRLIFDLQENYNPDVLAKIMKYHKEPHVGWLFFGVQQIQADEIINAPDIKVEKDQKSPSQRLRNRLWVYYKEVFGTADGFDSWYIGEMDKIGNRYLEAIE